MVRIAASVVDWLVVVSTIDFDVVKVSVELRVDKVELDSVGLFDDTVLNISSELDSELG